MMRIKPPYHRVSIAGCIALLYVVLVGLSTSCALAHAGGAQDHHHHKDNGSSEQSAFCAWACHAPSDIAMATEQPAAVVRCAIGTVLPAPELYVASSSLAIHHSRAPPSDSLILVG